MELSGIGSLLGIKSPWILKEIVVQKENHVIDVYIDFEPGIKFPCTCCGKLTSVYDCRVKRIRHLDLFDYRCYLNIKIPRTNCDKDGVRVTHVDPWSRKGGHYSLKFEALILRLCKEMSMSALSKEIGEPDNNLWRTFHHYVKTSILENLNLEDVKRVCVDETAVKRGHNYITIFTDYDTGKVLYVTEGRKKEVFDEFYGWLWDHNGHPGNIEIFSMDMSVSYQAGQREYFAGAELVFDRFHIKKCLNKAINEVRVQEVKTTDVLKNTKYLWLKNETNLTENQKTQLDNFLKDTSLNITKAYYIKNGFDQMWNVQKKAIEPLMEKWIENALTLDLKPITKFIETLLNHYDGIIKSIQTGITNAISEGLNSVMQLARTRARGFRNTNNFIAMVYFLGSA